MDTYIWIYIIIGFLGLSLPWLKRIEEFQLPNMPLVAIALGIVVYWLPINLPDPDPIKYEKEILKLSEIAVIISLMGAGLKINREFSFKAYKVPLLLVVVTMIGCIATTALLGWWFGLVPASAILLGAVFAPTDPVLASDVQVSIEEEENEEHPVKFNLTAEAGINDGMAFPFTWLAVWICMYGFGQGDWLTSWFFKDVVYRILAGLALGYSFGKLFAWLFFELPKKLDFSPKLLGILAVAITLFVYGVTEAVHGYGFIAVFVAALTIRHYEKAHKFHKEMHDVIEQIEHLMVIIILFLLGNYIAHHAFENLTGPMVLLCLLFIFVIRPLFGILTTFGSSMNWKQRWSMAFLGIKGIGSFFYLAFALHEVDFIQEELLWGTVAFLVLTSAVVHRLAGFYIKKNIL